MSALDWLIARPVAHRGLHDGARGIIENTPSAFSAAVAANYAIECDVQVTSDGDAIVAHDDALGRLTYGNDRVDALTAVDLKRVRFKGTTDRMITLGDLCDLVAGRVTLVVEIKSQFNRDRRLVARAAQVLRNYRGPAAAMSFDPAQIVVLRELAPTVARGIVAQRRYSSAEWPGLSEHTRRALGYFSHTLRTRPQFVAYSVKDLPAAVPFLARTVLGLPILTWTVRNDDDRRRAAGYADQMIFEGFRP